MLEGLFNGYRPVQNEFILKLLRSSGSRVIYQVCLFLLNLKIKATSARVLPFQGKLMDLSLFCHVVLLYFIVWSIFGHDPFHMLQESFAWWCGLKKSQLLMLITAVCVSACRLEINISTIEVGQPGGVSVKHHPCELTSYFCWWSMHPLSTDVPIIKWHK